MGHVLQLRRLLVIYVILKWLLAGAKTTPTACPTLRQSNEPGRTTEHGCDAAFWSSNHPVGCFSAKPANYVRSSAGQLSKLT